MYKNGIKKEYLFDERDKKTAHKVVKDIGNAMNNRVTVEF